MTEPQPKRKTQRERRAQSERRIIRAAADLFAEQGFLRTTLNQVGAAAGYTGGLVSHRFGSKEGLLQAVVKQMARRFRDDQLNEALQSVGASTSLERLIEVYLNEAVVREKRIRTLYVILGASLAAVPEIREGVSDLNNAARAMIAKLVALGQKEGVFREDVHADQAACAILGTLRGVVTQYLADSNSVDIEAQVPLVKDMALRGLK